MTDMQRGELKSMANLNGKTVLITAAGQGIGRASALAFIAAGAKVHATDINETALSELPKLDNLTTAKLDVLNEDAVKACVSDIGQVDVLFNCAGVVHAGSVLEMPDSDLDFAFDLNVRAMIRTIILRDLGRSFRSGGIWLTIAVLPFIGLVIAAVLIVAFAVVILVRRRRLARDDR